jgi:hypothetical protein
MMSGPPRPEPPMSRALPLLSLALLLGCPPSDVDEPKDDTGPGGDCTDQDGDGYCEEVDCDDGDPDVNPGIDEESMGPDELDNDCDGVVDECSEDDPELTWHAEELCDGIDNDCDGEVDEDLGEIWFPDADGDGYGDGDDPRQECDPGSGLVRDGSDCDDGDPAVHPGAPEACNGVDDDCDPRTTEDGTIALDGSGGFASIQEAIDAADEGATVSVCAGTWEESLLISTSLSLVAPAGPELTEIVGASEASVINAGEGSVSIRGFTISGGAGTVLDAEAGTRGGGGVLGWDSSELLVEDCIITGNEADFGGGVLGPDEGLLTMRGCTVSGNHAGTAGGGVYALDGVLEDCELLENSSGSSGGGIYHYLNALELSGCTISGNTASYGGGMRAFEDSVVGEDTVFSGNSADYGGGVYMRNDSNIAGLTVRDNSAGYGAGIYCREDCILSDSSLEGNVATDYGGGMMCRDGVTALTRVTVDGGQAYGGGGVLSDTCDLTLEEVTVSGSTADYGGGFYLVDAQVEAGSGVMVSGNSGVNAGGGVYISSNSTWDGGTISGNSAGSGGGLYLYGLGVLDDVTISGNSATDWGGALMVVTATDLLDLVIDGNDAAYGGGLYVYSDGEVLLDGSTLTSNIASERGGGVRVGAGILNISASDLGSKKLDNTPDDIYAGGQAYTDLGTVKALSCSGSEGCS